MNSTQNKKIEQVKETTMIIEKYYFRTFNWRDIELTRKPVALFKLYGGIQQPLQYDYGANAEK